MSMTHRQIRTVLADMVSGIAGIGTVHEYERWSKRTELLRDFYGYTPAGESVAQVRGWYIHRVNEADIVGASFCQTRNDAWEIRGFMSLDDANESELVFDDLVDSISTRFFDNDPVLPGLRIVDSEQGQRARLVQLQPVMFAGVLCHSAVIALKTAGSL